MDALKPEDPARIGPFIPLARIGAGGMGRVYLARSRGGRPVAVKVIRAEYAEDELFRSRFRREVQAARSVDGLYTASVLDAGPDDEEPWMATRYIPGPSLQRVVHDHGPLGERSARVLGAGIAEALGAIHSAGLIHRDLKPSNVICGPDGPRVIDFGISYAAGGSSLTTTGVIVGSARYASPEQCRAVPDLQPASDVFALGGVLVYATTGVPPFGEGPEHVQLYLVVHEKPDLAGVPAALRPVVSACLEKEPGNRPTTDELLDALLPPDDAGATSSVDWLPASVHQDMQNYSVGDDGHSGNGQTGNEDPAQTPPPGATDATGVSQARDPSRRRILAGILGVGAVAASGGAWYAATRHNGGKTTTQNAGASAPIGTPANSTAALSPVSSPSPSSTPAPAHTLGKWAEDWSSKLNLGGSWYGDAVVCGNMLVSVYTGPSRDPNPPQTLIGLDSATGKLLWNPVTLPGLDSPIGMGLAADADYIYTYSAGVVYAWRVSDGSAAWNAKTGLPPSTADNGMPLVGIQGLTAGVLIISPGGYGGDSPPCIAGFDVAKRTTVWTMKNADLLVPLPPGLATTDANPNLAVPKQGGLLYVTVSDNVSVRLLKGVDPKTGKDVWRIPFPTYATNGAALNIPTVTGTANHVYLTDMRNGSVQAYDASNGKWEWSYPSGNGAAIQPSGQRFTGPVVESGDTVYATDATSVMALQISTASKTGTALWSEPTHFKGLRGAPAVVGDKIWIEVQNSNRVKALTVLNGKDGQTVKQYAMPAAKDVEVDSDLLVPDPAKPAIYVLTASGEVLGYQRDQ